MTSPAKLNEYNHAEEPARTLLEQLGWSYVPRDALAAERGDEREVLLKGRLLGALLRLNQWMTEEQADRVVFDLEHVDATGMARNQRVHEYLTYGMPLTVDTPQGRGTRIVRFFDFDHTEGGLNEFVVATQFRVRRGNERGGADNDETMVIPDLVLFVNGIPLVVMEAKSPTLENEWRYRAVRQLAPLPGGRAGVARVWSAGSIPLQPALRGALRGCRGLRRPRSAGERLLRVEIGAALLRRRGPTAVRRRAAGPGTAYRRTAGALDASGHAARLRCVRAGAGAAW